MNSSTSYMRGLFRARCAVSAGACLALLLLPTAAKATDYVISSAGNDSASGESGSPWKTLQRAWRSLRAGDTVTVEDGSYAGFACDGVSGTASARIVFRSRNPLGAKINAPAAGVDSDVGEDYVQLSSCSYITVDGFEVSGAPRSGIAILGIEDDGSDARGVIIQNCYSHNNGGTTVSGRHDGIFSGFALDLTIQDNRVDTTGEHGIYVSNAGDNPAILRNQVSNTGSNCIQINADLSTGGDGLISNWVIEGNVVHDCKGAAAFNLDGAIQGVARNNVIYNAAKGGITLFKGDGAQASHDNLIVNNTIYNSSGSRSAIQIADGANNNVLFNNILYAKSAGLEVQSVTGLVHDYNLISSTDGASLEAHESSPTASTLFAGAATGDLKLVAASAAVDHGVATLGGKAAPTTDILRAARPAGSAYDIGAYEFGATGASTGTGGSGNPTTTQPTGDGGASTATSPGNRGGAMNNVGGQSSPSASSGGVHEGTSGGSGGDSPSPSAAGKASAQANASDGGCGCRLGGGRLETSALWMALALSVLGGARRRRPMARLGNPGSTHR